MKYPRVSKNILSHQSKGGPPLNISKIIPSKIKGRSGSHHLKICACDTNRVINIHQCGIKFIVKGIDSYEYCPDINDHESTYCSFCMSVTYIRRYIGHCVDSANTRTDKMLI